MEDRTFRIPHGRGYQEVRVPERNLLGVLESKEYRTGRTQQEIIRGALGHPIGSPRLSDLCKGRRSLLLVTNDMTRPMPSKITVPALLEEIRSGSPDARITIIVASGLHRAMTRDELIAKLGEDIVNNYRIVVHNAYDKENLVSLGRLSTGNELLVNREVVENDLVIAEGFIEAHWLAGFSGGRKSIMPGLCGAETVMNNHSAANVDHPMARPGVLAGNPVHEEFAEAARMAGLAFILNVVLDKEKKIVNAFAGDTFAAHEAGCGFVRELMQAPCRPADIVITSNSGYPLDINLYQSMKGMDTAAAAAKDGAVLIVSTECPEGVGHGGFRDVYASGTSIAEILEKLKSGSVRIFDQWGAQVMLKLSAKYSIIVVTKNINCKELESMYVLHAPDVQAAFDMAMQIKGKDATVNVIPEGPVILPVVTAKSPPAPDGASPLVKGGMSRKRQGDFGDAPAGQGGSEGSNRMDMTRIHQVAWIGDDWLRGPIRRVVLSLHGLGYNLDKEEPETLELGFAQAGGLVVFPHYGPWCWMNRSARAFVDDLVQSVYACYKLDESVPLVATGGSMGGLSSLLYARYGRRRPVACLALLPVCDLKWTFGSRPDFPKTILHAFRDYPEDLDTLFEEHSPICQVPHMPDIPYLIVSGGKDQAVPKERHSDVFVERMRALGRNVEYIVVPYMGHGSPMPVEAMNRMVRFVETEGKG